MRPSRQSETFTKRVTQPNPYNQNFFTLWLYSPIQALTASMKFSLQLLDIGQSVGLLGRVISSYTAVHKHRKMHA
jgi:hypothetical protein